MSDGRLSPVEVTSGKPDRYRGGSPSGGRRQPQATDLAPTPEEELARQLREAIDAGKLRRGLVILDPVLAEAIHRSLVSRLTAIQKLGGAPARRQEQRREDDRRRRP